jgi:hypothetical protein
MRAPLSNATGTAGAGSAKHLDKEWSLHYKPVQHDKRLEVVRSAAYPGNARKTGGGGMRTSKIRKWLGVFVFALVLLSCSRLIAGVTASISGTVTDPTGAVVAGAAVTATNVDTGVALSQTTNAQGFYSFQELPVGKYTIDVQKTGFKAYRQTGLVLDVNQALGVDVPLQIGEASEKVEVSSAALHVDTESTQMGEVITGKEMTDVPLVTRSYTDLLALQPGVVPSASQMSGAFAGPFRWCRAI